MTFVTVPGLQVDGVKQAERFAPQAVDVGSGLNITAFNLGIAGAARAGGLIVTHLGLQYTPWSGALDRRGEMAFRSNRPLPRPICRVQPVRS